MTGIGIAIGVQQRCWVTGIWIEVGLKELRSKLVAGIEIDRYLSGS